MTDNIYRVNTTKDGSIDFHTQQEADDFIVFYQVTQIEDVPKEINSKVTKYAVVTQNNQILFDTEQERATYIEDNEYVKLLNVEINEPIDITEYKLIHNNDTLTFDTEQERTTYISQINASIEIFEPTIDNSAIMYSTIEDVLTSAINFGQKLMKDFIIENITLGITQRGLTSHVRKITSELITCLNTGSLYDAISEIKLITPASLDPVILSEARMLSFRNKVHEYLGLPLVTTWNQQ